MNVSQLLTIDTTAGRIMSMRSIYRHQEIASRRLKKYIFPKLILFLLCEINKHELNTILILASLRNAGDVDRYLFCSVIQT